jgi:hypothetical protein
MKEAAGDERPGFGASFGELSNPTPDPTPTTPLPSFHPPTPDWAKEERERQFREMSHEERLHAVGNGEEEPGS